MRTTVAILLTLCAAILALTPGTNAVDLTLTDVTPSYQSPFLSTVQSVFRYLKPVDEDASSTSGKRLRLKTIFHQGTRSYRGLSARYDVNPQASAQVTADADAHLTIMKTVKVKTWKPRDTRALLHAHREGDAIGVMQTSRAVEWDETEVDAPDVSDRETLLALGKMASKAYDAPINATGNEWKVGNGKWNLTESFGWVEDGIRGHIFATEDNSTIVVALKGTSAALLDDGSTSKRDKENDNLLFSCCCAHVGWTWRTVCDCYDKAKVSPSLSTSAETQTCASSCLTKAIIEKSFYYPATTDLFNNISYAYPDANIWITGHSLGGALGALIGMTFGYPTVTFEAPAERMAAVRLHLPLPVKHDNMDALPITHVYHTADPIPNGECVGATSLCANFGFAMESKCHSGKSIIYDTIGKLGWSSSVVTHRIATLVDDLLTEDWDKRVEKEKAKSSTSSTAGIDAQSKHEFWLKRIRLPWQRSEEDDKKKEEKLGSVPALKSEKHCKDCLDWTFVDEDDKKVQGV